MSDELGLRERKKRETRQRISNVATGMFLERGFDAVTVAEIASECDVSEKTVFNYFPTKEGLLLDRELSMAEAIRDALGPGAIVESPIKAAVGVLRNDIEQLVTLWESTAVPVDLSQFQRFTQLMDSTASLRAAQQDMMSRLVQVAATALAERGGVDPDAPEPQIAAEAIMGLWRVQFGALRRAATACVDSPEEVRRQVTSEVERAALLIETGLWAFSVMVTTAGDREKFEAAAKLAGSHAREVAKAIRDAKRAWRQASRQLRRNH